MNVLCGKCYTVFLIVMLICVISNAENVSCHCECYGDVIMFLLNQKYSFYETSVHSGSGKHMGCVTAPGHVGTVIE